MRMRVRVSAAALLGLVACHGAAPPQTAHTPEPRPPSALAPRGVDEGPPSPGLAACQGLRLDVAFDELRAFRRAPWVRAILMAEPRFSELEIPKEISPFDDVVWARFCGARAFSWDAVALRHGLSAAKIEGALRTYGRRVDQGGPFALGLPGKRAHRIRVATDVWTALLSDDAPDEVWLLAPSAAANAARDEAFAKAERATRPAITVVATEPSVRFPWAAEDLRGLERLRATVALRDDGGAEVEGTGEAKGEVEAHTIAARMNATVAVAASAFVVRVALRGALSGFSAEAHGRSVSMRLPLSPAQVDSVLSLVGAHLGAHFPGAAAPKGP